ncbi:MAG: hypothetical protein PF694_08080 [Bacteroidetes bacterium]|jgi:hypothetical protein|nr:hypothetical protein [Bacteroidota bacterium]
MKNLFRGLSILGFIICSLAYGQTIPRSEQEIPVFSGAERNLPEQKQALKDYLETHEGEPIRDIRLSVYTAKVEPSEVCRFYIEKLGAKEGFPEYDEGVNTKPWYEVSYFSERDFEEQWEFDTKIWDGKWLKTAVAKRKQWEPGKWLASAIFEWTVLLDNGDIKRFSIDIIDDSYDTRARIISDKTILTIVSRIEKSEENQDEEEDERLDEAYEQKMASLSGNPPTAQSLGIPFYPGWNFRPELSAGMSLNEDFEYFVFTTSDGAKKVAAFYEQKLNKKAFDSGFGYILALKGALPVPDEGLTIQENTMVDGNAETVITIQKER